MSVDNERLVKIYLKMRAFKKEMAARHKAEMAEIEDKMATVDGLLLSSLNTSKVNSMGTTFGTFYKQEDIKPSCANWPEYHAWIAENGAWDGLEKRVGRNFIADYLKQNDNAAPPGIIILREYSVHVRTA